MQNLDFSELIIKDVLSINIYYSGKNESGKMTNRSHWAFIQKYEGETTYVSNGKIYHSNASSMILAPKGCSYKWTSVEAGHFVIIDFNCDESCNGILSFSPVNAELVLNAVKNLKYEETMNPKLYRILCMEKAYRILGMLIKASQVPYLDTKKKENLKEVFTYIAEHYNEKIKIDDLATLTPYSTVYFRKLFTEMTGSSPISYIHTLRIKRAKELLQSDYGSISDIASFLGYTNIYEFSRTFKKHTGLSPTHFARVHSVG